MVRSERQRRSRTGGEGFRGGFLEARRAKVEVLPFRDGFFPEHGEAIKSWFETLKSRVKPDLIHALSR